MTMVQPLFAVVLMATLLPFGGPAHRKTEQGNRQYDAQEFEEALRLYTEAQVELPEAPELLYDIGNVLYRRGDYDGAMEAWTRAGETASPQLQPDISHNLGNARFKKQEYQEAADAYRESLKLRPDDLDTKRNLELAALRLQEQQQQQQSQDQQDEKDKEEEQDQEKQDNDKKDQEQSKDQNEQQQDGKPDGDPDEEDKQDSQPKPQPQPERTEGKMSKEDAERLLDSLENQEKDNLKEEAGRKAARRATKREKDW
jgi:Ca-activated chloride channel family protein